LNSRSTRTCSGILAASSSPTMATTRGRSKIFSDTVRFSIRALHRAIARAVQTVLDRLTARERRPVDPSEATESPIMSSGLRCCICRSGSRTRPDQPRSPPGALRQNRSSGPGWAGGDLLQRFFVDMAPPSLDAGRSSVALPGRVRNANSRASRGLTALPYKGKICYALGWPRAGARECGKRSRTAFAV
jgi:hypothetical protein